MQEEGSGPEWLRMANAGGVTEVAGVRNLNSDVKAMESKRRVSHGGGKPLWLQWEG